MAIGSLPGRRRPPPKYSTNSGRAASSGSGSMRAAVDTLKVTREGGFENGVGATREWKDSGGGA